MAANTAHEHGGGNTRLYLIVWGWLIALTAVEVILGYIQIPLTIMLIVVMGLSIIKAVLIVAYFMHLKFERMSLILTIVPAVVVCISLLAIFFPDSFRALNLRAYR
jgi:cytochrome c oxidase subunit 4